MPPRPEERARETINRQLAAAGWLVLYAGIHYRFDIEAGLLGRQVAEHVLSTDVTGHEPIPLD